MQRQCAAIKKVAEPVETGGRAINALGGQTSVIYLIRSPVGFVECEETMKTHHLIYLMGRMAVVGCCAVALGASQLSATPQVKLEPFAEGMTAPLWMVSYGSTDDFLVIDQVGIIHYLQAGGTVRDEPFLDLRERMVELRAGFDERGLLGLALHPEFDENGRLFVYYSAALREEADPEFNHTSRISEFTLGEGDEPQADLDSEKVRMEIDQPQFNHNGGTLLFGSDGYLYISVGDGGGANDTGTGHPPEGNGQDITTPLGTILRIDIEVDEGFGVPDDNPFVGTDGRDEIFAYGLRNVWGMSFDRAHPDRLFAADVGQDLYEEVNIITKGGNYGWNIREGFHCFDPENPRDSPEDCPEEGARGEPLLDPIFEYKNRKFFGDEEDAYGVCIVGGFVYRGEAIPGLQGHYVFGDWTRAWGAADGTLLMATPPEGDDIMKPWQVGVFASSDRSDGLLETYILGFGEDRHGELYVLTSQREQPTGETGRIYKLVPDGD